VYLVIFVIFNLSVNEIDVRLVEQLEKYFRRNRILLQLHNLDQHWDFFTKTERDIVTLIFTGHKFGNTYLSELPRELIHLLICHVLVYYSC